MQSASDIEIFKLAAIEDRVLVSKQIIWYIVTYGMIKAICNFIASSPEAIPQAQLAFFSKHLPNVEKPQNRGAKILRKNVRSLGFPIKDFGNDRVRRSSPLSIFIRGPQHLNTKEKAKTSGCLIKDFRHDGRGVIPECLYHLCPSPRQLASRF